MALINCPECNKEISETAKFCPGCGFKQKRKFAISKKFGILPIILVGIVVIILLASYIAGHRKYKIADRIHLGMSKESAEKILGDKFDLYITDDEISLYNSSDYNGDYNKALTYFGLPKTAGIWAISLEFDDNNKLESVRYNGSGGCESAEDWCRCLGQTGAIMHFTGAWQKGYVQLSKDIVMLIGYCYEDPERTGYSADITTTEIARTRNGYRYP